VTATTPRAGAHVHRLPDGRALGFAEFGQPDGVPLIFCHGFPSSRLAGALLDRDARTLGVRVISPDRPGLGLSDYKRRRRIGHWPADVASLADALGLSRFAVLGVSAGGPYAAACAALLPERVSAAGIASGTAPRGAPTSGRSRGLGFGSGVGRRLPTLQRFLLGRVARRVSKDAMRFLDRRTTGLPPADRAVFDDPDIRRLFADDLREAFRQGGRGPAADARAANRRWGFRLEQIRVPVWLWHGQEDRNVPASVGRHVADRVPGSRAMFYRSDGHISTLVNHVGEMLGALVGEGGG
jgi:pimeloyl-ACP methyl ester carboxylesterase